MTGDKDKTGRSEGSPEPPGAEGVDENMEEDEMREGMELSEGADDLKSELSQVKVVTPKPTMPIDIFDESEFPDSYRQNNNKEKVVLAYIDNYRRQYVHLYRDRKPLLLYPKNELGIEKFVCSTIRPVELPYKEMYEWEGCAAFVADYLNYQPILPEHEMPQRMYAPMTVLRLQKGHSFEYSTLLASLLIGAGYDAYVVSGYAGREMTLYDQTYDSCPLLDTKEEVVPPPPPPPSKKYMVRPPKDLRSKFEQRQEEKRMKLIADEEDKLRRAEEERIRLSEMPPPDPLFGLRVHSWVLVLSGKKEVAESFFIEPTSGLSHPLDTSLYLGIESVWNNKNYWTNMQDCSEGVITLQYDLGDCAQWEYIFPSNDKPELLLPIADSSKPRDPLADDEEEENEDEIENHLDLPPSWTKRIVVPPADFEKRYPGGRKLTVYKRAKWEQFAPYLLKDGLVSRISIYEDLLWTNLLEVREVYANRADKLISRRYNYRTNWITENYAPGRARNIKEHQYGVGGVNPESDRLLTYYSSARIDGLSKLIDRPRSLTQHYIHRADCLVYRHVQFGVRPKKFGPAESTDRPIEIMTERYERNESIEANEDIEEMIYNRQENKVYIKYHKDLTKISSSTREFIKPSTFDDKGVGIVWDVSGHTTFQSDPTRKDKKNVEIYEMMMSLLKSEVVCEDKVREGEREVRDTLDERMREEASSELEVSIFDTLRNDKAVKRRNQLEKQQQEAAEQSQEKTLDYLAPYIIGLDNPSRLTRTEALKIRDLALADLKQRLIDKANLIQARFEKETGELQKRQAWYQQNQLSMEKADEQEYLNYSSEAMFRIHILELRLNRHKEMAPLKYMALEQKLRTDPRLSDYIK